MTRSINHHATTVVEDMTHAALSPAVIQVKSSRGVRRRVDWATRCQRNEQFMPLRFLPAYIQDRAVPEMHIFLEIMYNTIVRW